MLYMREKCPYSELFWSAFSRNKTEYGQIRSIQSKCGKMGTRITPNTDIFYAVYGIWSEIQKSAKLTSRILPILWD